MDMTRIKEEALANAARNKSSEQVSLVWQHKQNIAKENKDNIKESSNDKQASISSSPNLTHRKRENVLDLIDKECQNTEDKVTKRMEVLIEEVMKNVESTAEKNTTRKSDTVQCACISNATRYEKTVGKEREIKMLIGKDI